MENYLVHIIIISCIYLQLSLGQFYVLGWAGIFNLSHVAIFAIGAYSLAILTTKFQVNFYQALIMAPFISVTFAVPVAMISFRLKGDYFALGSLAFALVIETILINYRSLTNGVLGIAGIARPEDKFFFLTIFITVLFLLISQIIAGSSFKLFLKAQSEFEESAMSLGINTGFFRVLAFVLSSLYAGIAGGLFSAYISFIDPSSFALSEMIFILSILVISGLNKIRNIVFATLFLVILPESLRFTPISSSYLGPARQFLYASILFLVVYLKKDKLFELSRKL